MSSRNRKEIPGNDLLSRPVARAVPSAQTGLTAVFGMGTGVTPSLWSPDISLYTKKDEVCEVRHHDAFANVSRCRRDAPSGGTP